MSEHEAVFRMLADGLPEATHIVHRPDGPPLYRCRTHSFFLPDGYRAEDAPADNGHTCLDCANERYGWHMNMSVMRRYA